MTESELELKRRFLATVDIAAYRERGFPGCLVISFTGGIGSGKTYISQRLSEALDIPIFDNDGIRRFLNDQGVEGAHPLQELVVDIARTRMKSLLENGISYILDADLTTTYRQDVERMSAFGFELVLIKINCPPELVVARIEKRQQAGGSSSLADVAKYHQREAVRHTAQIDDADMFFTVDASLPVEPQLKRLVAQIWARVERRSMATVPKKTA